MIAIGKGRKSYLKLTTSVPTAGKRQVSSFVRSPIVRMRLIAEEVSKVECWERVQSLRPESMASS